MANIMITNVCNLNCSYCFANEFVNKKKVNHISIKSFQRILDFIETASANEHVGLIGGEPTLHPRFMELLSIINQRVNLQDVIVFTNGICMDKYYEELQNPKINLLINCNSPQIIGDNIFQKIKRNIKIAVNNYGMRDRITLGLNIFSKEIEYKHILELIDEFGFDHLRLSIVVPNGHKNLDPLTYFNEMKTITLDIIMDILRHGAMPYFDCNKLPVCILSKKEREDLLQACGTRPISNIISEFSNCSPVLDILQDETCVRCFGLSEYLKVNINGFDTLDDLRGFFEGQIDVFAHKVFYNEQCANCYERMCKKCSGGCLLYKIDKIAKKVNLFE